MNTLTASLAPAKKSSRTARGHGTLLMLALAAACLPVTNAAAEGPRAMPSHPGQVMLILNTLTALNHGNITGNYTVLRDLASERFRHRNTAADLARTFANLRKQTGDLSPILVTEPRLTQRPTLDQFGRMELTGHFPTQPKAVRFGLVFQRTDAGWVIDEITVGVAPVESLVRTQHSPPLSQAIFTPTRPVWQR